MDKADREKITSNKDQLINLIKFDLIKDHLVPLQVFTEEMLKDFEELDEGEQMAEVIGDLPSRGPKAFAAFLTILYETGQLAAATILGPEPTHWPNQNNHRHQGGARIDSRFGEAILCERVQRSIEDFEGNDIYEMHSSPRGLCLLINNMEFRGCEDKYEFRAGSKRDEAVLTQVFTQLGFEVDCRNDLAANKMETALAEFCERPEHLQLDAAVIIILTHGKLGCLVGSDGKDVDWKKILRQFDNHNCPYLQNKPKLFFTQACRGTTHSHGARLRTDSKSDPKFSQYKETNQSYSIQEQEQTRLPSVSDILVSYSAIEDYVSYRDPVEGSWYIKALAEALIEHAHESEIIDLLRKTERTLQQFSGPEGERASAEYRSMGFSKKFYFNTLL